MSQTRAVSTMPELAGKIPARYSTYRYFQSRHEVYDEGAGAWVLLFLILSELGVEDAQLTAMAEALVTYTEADGVVETPTVYDLVSSDAPTVMLDGGSDLGGDGGDGD